MYGYLYVMNIDITLYVMVYSCRCINASKVLGYICLFLVCLKVIEVYKKLYFQPTFLYFCTLWRYIKGKVYVESTLLYMYNIGLF